MTLGAEDGTLGGPGFLFDGSNGYCTADDVAVLLEQDWTGATKPTLDSIQLLIVQATEMIEQETKHAWRAVTVVDEYHDSRWLAFSRGFWGWEVAIKLRHRMVRSVAKLEWWTGSAWTDFILTETEGRDAAWWANYSTGQLFLRTRFPLTSVESVRVTYVYGETAVPGDIRLTCAKMVAKECARGENRVELLTEGSSHLTWGDKINMWDKEIEKTLARHREMTVGMI